MHNNPKVLVACPVNECKSYCIGDYLDNILKLTYPNKDFYFVDNSEGVEWYNKNIWEKGFNCDHVSPYGKKNNEILWECQEMIRYEALEWGYSHLAMIECDMFPHPTIIEEMLAYETNLVTCDYFVAKGEESTLLRMDIEDTFGNYTNRKMNFLESFLDHGQRSPKAKQLGFGCCLFSRQILQEIPFTISENDSFHADTHYYFMANQKGIPIKIHNTIIEHRNSSWANVTNR